MQADVLFQSVKGRNWPVAVIIVLGLCVYANSFHGVYFPDDYRNIPGLAPPAPTVEQKGPTAEAFSYAVKDAPAPPPSPAGYYARPVVRLSLALNHFISKTDIWSYHLANIAIHLLAALVLFGIVRRTLASKALEKYFAAEAAPGLALLCALIWLVHPLQTETVTYIIQRSESLAGLFYLLVIYCLIRSASSEMEKPWLWGGAAASFLGMCAKPVLVTVPVMAFLYDRAFLSGSCAEALRRRWRFYEKLLFTAALGFAFAFLDPTSPSVGLGQWRQSLDYLQSQFSVVLHYLRLALWPDALCLDYWWPAATHQMQQDIPPVLAAGALVVGTVWACVKKPAMGFLGAWFFLLLAPTSSFIPLANKAVEHRLYLPLAALAAGAVLAGYGLAEYIQRHAGLTGRASAQLKFFAYEAAVLVIVTLAILTIQRNRDYASQIGMWRDTLKKAPDNPRVCNFLGLAYSRENKIDLAEAAFEDSLRKDPSYWQANANLGALHEAKGNKAQAIACYMGALRYNNDPLLKHKTAVLCDSYGRELLNKKPPAAQDAEAQFRNATGIDPQYEPPFLSLGTLLNARGDFMGAVQALSVSNKLGPGRVEVFQQLGQAYCGLGSHEVSKSKWDNALPYFEEAVRFYPDYAPAIKGRDEAKTQKKRLDEQQTVFANTLKTIREALKKNPADPTPRNDIAYWDNGLGLFLMDRDRYPEAAEAFEEIIKIKPDYWQAHFNLGVSYQQMGKLTEAAQHYNDALHLNPSFASAKASLANLYNDNLGLPKLNEAKFPEAEEFFRQAVKVEPSFWQAWYNLGLALQRQGKLAEAMAAYKETLRINPGYDMAKGRMMEINGK